MNEAQGYVLLGTLIVSLGALAIGIACLRVSLRQERRRREMKITDLLAVKDDFIGGTFCYSLFSDREVVGEVSDIRLVRRGKYDSDLKLVISSAWSAIRRASNRLEAESSPGRDIEIIWPEDALVLNRCKHDNLHRVIVVAAGVQGFLVLNRKGLPGPSRDDVARASGP